MTKKVLWVDNDPVVRIAGKRLLEADNRYSVLLAASGAEAIKMALREPPQLIILDLIMPGFDGLETLKRLRSQGTAAHVVLLTAKTQAEMQDESVFKDLGVVRTFHKPLDTGSFVQFVDALLGA